MVRFSRGPLNDRLGVFEEWQGISRASFPHGVSGLGGFWGGVRALRFRCPGVLRDREEGSKGLLLQGFQVFGHWGPPRPSLPAARDGGWDVAGSII